LAPTCLVWRPWDLTQVTDIWTSVETYLAAERLELDDLEVTGRGRGRVVRITVDGEGIGIDRLAELSRGLSRLLDDEPGLQDTYQLEVSSPGLERKLRRPSHYRKSVGREVVVKSAVGDGKTTHRGLITGAGDEEFTIDSDDGEVTVAYDDVITAKTVYRWERAPKPGHFKENA